MAIENPSEPLSSIQPHIEEQSGIPVSQQEFLFSTGLGADPKKPIDVCWNEAVSSGKETVMTEMIIYPSYLSANKFN